MDDCSLSFRALAATRMVLRPATSMVMPMKYETVPA